ncbi:uncharacterized protein KD926_004998 [Aspergillus affinis]|uniref:uncharacterized protein n=1 Tax=Aspergillus affinis TaxID=1070780 RepID=UPI0022FF406B|nr:uncharacterized protein KD926_004998 [Aspergillus affinis]KAI9034950.1 hypothetical protein KD926_004998 [Aspergillus affinis]
MRQSARRLIESLYEPLYRIPPYLQDYPFVGSDTETSSSPNSEGRAELAPVQQEETLIDLSQEMDVDPTPSETEPSIAQQINMISEPETPAPVTPAPRGRTLSKRRPRIVTSLGATRRSARHQVTQEAAPIASSPATGDTPPAKRTRSKQPTYRERSVSTSDITSDNVVTAFLKSPEASLIPAPTPSGHLTTIVLAEDNTLARSVSRKRDERARVCLFISRQIDFNTWKHTPHSRDIQELDLTDADGTLGLVSDLTINNINDYVLLLGDFNLHHPTWGGENAARDTLSNQLLDLSDRRYLDLWLEPGITIRDEAGTKTTIDLVLGSQDLTPRLVTCEVTEKIYADSDHLPIRTLIDI